MVDLEPEYRNRIISVGFGYSFYFRHLRADDYAHEVHQSESQRMLLEGESYRARFNTTALSLNELSAYSQSQSELEDRRGETRVVNV